MTSSWSTKRHLDVELGELGLAVGAEVLVAVAAGDLVVALHAGDHEQLLEQLRGLRQGVPGARLQARGHQEVARALGRRAGEGRGLDLEEVLRRRARRGRSRLTRLRSRSAARGRRRGAGPGSGSAAGPPRRPRRARRSGTAAAPRSQRTSTSVATTSTSPVGRSGFSLPSGRADTSPTTLTQYSLRSGCATSASRTTTWTTPEASRRSRKATPPWSRRRATQPASVTVCADVLGARGFRRRGCGSRVALLVLEAGQRTTGARSSGGRRPACRVGRRPARPTGCP